MEAPEVGSRLRKERMTRKNKETGTCPHGTFPLLEGCPQCIMERQGTGGAPPTTPTITATITGEAIVEEQPEERLGISLSGGIPEGILTTSEGGYKMTELEKSTRYRINISTSVKGVHTFDSTVDMLNASMEEVLAESDKLVLELDRRYPPPIEVK